ncbi:MAG TPA: hypothetical protein PKK94_01805, partial [Leptospiraceae bacterium]|nr:hypothetical protein [Leptospiraceae bacterium]
LDANGADGGGEERRVVDRVVLPRAHQLNRMPIRNKKSGSGNKKSHRSEIEMKMQNISSSE